MGLDSIFFLFFCIKNFYFCLCTETWKDNFFFGSPIRSKSKEKKQKMEKETNQKKTLFSKAEQYEKDMYSYWCTRVEYMNQLYVSDQNAQAQIEKDLAKNTKKTKTKTDDQVPMLPYLSAHRRTVIRN